ncbi:MAG TPA: hypothetical protein VK190_04555 [Pseudoneobacillus sp.]|nr:hypothetical protein [Pseudoneobacillus sp.]
MRKEIFAGSNRIESYGILGEYVGLKDFHVGDCVAYLKDGRIKTGLILEDTETGMFCVLGWFGTSFEDWYNKVERVTKILSYGNLTVDIANEITGNKNYFKEIKELTVKKMTLKEIEKQLGYHIELMEESKC